MKEVEGRPNWVELEVGDVILSCDWFVYSDNLREVKMRHGATTEILHGGRGAYAATLIGTEYKGFDAEGICFYRRKPSNLSAPSTTYKGWWILGPELEIKSGDRYSFFGSTIDGMPGTPTDEASGSSRTGSTVKKANGVGATIYRRMT